MAGLVPAIHALLTYQKAWMPGTRFTLGPAMTNSKAHYGQGFAVLMSSEDIVPRMLKSE